MNKFKSRKFIFVFLFFIFAVAGVFSGVVSDTVAVILVTGSLALIMVYLFANVLQKIKLGPLDMTTRKTTKTERELKKVRKDSQYWTELYCERVEKAIWLEKRLRDELDYVDGNPSISFHEVISRFRTILDELDHKDMDKIRKNFSGDPGEGASE